MQVDHISSRGGIATFLFDTGKLLMLLLPLGLVFFQIFLKIDIASAPYSWGTLVVLCIYSFSVFGSSFFISFVRQQSQYFLLGLFLLAALHLGYLMHLEKLSAQTYIGFSFFSLASMLYIPNRKDLYLYQSLLVLILLLMYMVHFEGVDSPSSYFLGAYLFLLILTNIGIYQVQTRSNALAQQAVKYQDLLNRLQEGLIQFDASGRISHTNEVMSLWSGFEAEELSSRFDYAYFVQQSGWPEKEHLVLQKKWVNDLKEIQLTRKNGEHIWLSVELKPHLDEHGELNQISALFTDITKQKVSGERIRRLNKELNRANQHIEHKNMELERFAHLASTDLKMPLSMILNHAKKIGDFYDAEEDSAIEKNIRGVIDTSKRMSHLIDALLLYSLSGKKQFQPDYISLDKVLGEVNDSLAIYIQANNVKLISPTLPTVFADRIQMIRLFRNLIENAIKFRGSETPVINISFSEQSKEKRYIFTVEDNGIGISRDYHDQIFLLFQRNGNSAEQEKGVGMGLAICKKIIDNHSGKMWLKSTVGQGTAVYFTIPYGAEQNKYLMQQQLGARS